MFAVTPSSSDEVLSNEGEGERPKLAAGCPAVKMVDGIAGAGPDGVPTVRGAVVNGSVAACELLYSLALPPPCKSLRQPVGVRSVLSLPALSLPSLPPIRPSTAADAMARAF